MNKIKRVRATVIASLLLGVVLLFLWGQPLRAFVYQMKVTYGNEKTAVEALEESFKLGHLALPVLKAGIERKSLRKRTVVLACSKKYMIWAGSSNTLRLRTARELQDGSFADVEIIPFVAVNPVSQRADYSENCQFTIYTSGDGDRPAVSNKECRVQLTESEDFKLD